MTTSVTAAKGAVAAGHDITAEAAAEILQDGGNAYDAIVAGLLATTVAEPVFSSLGGGGCLMARPAATKHTDLYDFFVSAPNIKRPEDEIDFRSTYVQFGPATQEFHIGLGATAIPGFVSGLFAVHRDLCTLPLQRLAEPAIRVANSGLTVTSFQAYLFTVVEPILTEDEIAKQLFAPSGRLLKEGDVYKNPQLAETISALANEGERFFTEGDAANAIVKQSSELGGHLTEKDLTTYQTVKRRPLIWPYHQADVALNPAPAASGPLIGFGLGYLQTITQDSKADIAKLIAALKATNEIRKNWKNEDPVCDPTTIVDHIKALSGLTPATRGTTHISVIDKEGNAASATVTNGEGNGRMVGDLGFMLNNMLGEEDLNPGGFHQWTPGERLSTMMAPTLVTTSDGDITALGSGGSNRIRTALLQVIVNQVDKGLSLKDAIDEPRMHLEKCGTLSFEDLFDENDRTTIFEAYSDAKAWPDRNFFFGGVNAVQRLKNGNFDCYADPRRDGTAITAT